MIIAGFAGAVARGRRLAARLRDETLRRLPIGVDGIIPGAEGFELARGAEAPAILLLHGGGDTPQTLRYFAEYLHARGYHVRVPLLPGHGRTVTDFSRVAADDWMEAARSAYRDLTLAHRWVGVGGLSMGGALAARLAAEVRTLPALALLAPYVAMPSRISLAARLSLLWGVAVPYVSAVDPAAARSIHDREEAARSLGYGVFTPAALRALRATVAHAIEALPNVLCPTVMIQSREDNRVPAPVAQRAFDRIGASDKELVWVTGAGHVITVDYGRDRVFQIVGDFFDRHRGAVPIERRA
ncbi:MAG TPA: alpha/beta fold hydrolase [Gemmatimonadaceae bacterium]|nr:alpha/beta fold hydrolase [Gemmatimonadaceae bacterium]